MLYNSRRLQQAVQLQHAELQHTDGEHCPYKQSFLR